MIEEGLVQLETNGVQLYGNLLVPDNASGVVLFAHGSGSSRRSARNQFVARRLRADGLATLLFDLLTADEEAEDRVSRKQRFDISLLSRRLAGATDWIHNMQQIRHLKIGYFGASTGAAAALVAAAEKAYAVGAIVSRGGRPDLATAVLDRVKAPPLLIGGGDDFPVIELNRQAFKRLHMPKALQIVPGASHLFEEPGALEKVAEIASDWFVRYLNPDVKPAI